MSQETRPFRIEVRRGDDLTNVTLNLTLRQAAGIEFMGGLLRRDGGINGYAVVSMSSSLNQYLDFISQLTLHLQRPIGLDRSNPYVVAYNELIHFDPRTHNLVELLHRMHLHPLTDQRQRRYLALVRVMNELYLIQFNSLEFLQGMITVCNWFGLDYHNIILVVYDGNQPMISE
jgi:hypothetical protein